MTPEQEGPFVVRDDGIGPLGHRGVRVEMKKKHEFGPVWHFWDARNPDVEATRRMMNLAYKRGFDDGRAAKEEGKKCHTPQP